MNYIMIITYQKYHCIYCKYSIYSIIWDNSLKLFKS